MRTSKIIKKGYKINFVFFEIESNLSGNTLQLASFYSMNYLGLYSTKGLKHKHRVTTYILITRIRSTLKALPRRQAGVQAN